MSDLDVHFLKQFNPHRNPSMQAMCFLKGEDRAREAGSSQTAGLGTELVSNSNIVAESQLHVSAGCCFVTAYHKLSSFKQFIFIATPFLWSAVRTQFSWVSQG